MLDCKTQILSSISNNSCCSHAFLNIVILLNGQIDKYQNSILISSNKQIIEKTQKIIANFYPDIVVYEWDNFLMLKGNIYTLLTDINYDSTFNLTYFEAECDKLTILKTIFLLNGGVYYNQNNNSNSIGYDLEFVLKNETVLNAVNNLLLEFDFNLKQTKRHSTFVLYTKNSNTICDLLVKLGATYFALEMQNNLAVREMRNAANRQNNCFDANLEKTLNASEEQLNAINYIIKHHTIDYFDENLKEVALARVANPDVSLNDLKTLLGGKISRAGIKYRLDKIINIYNKLKGENK